MGEKQQLWYDFLIVIGQILFWGMVLFWSWLIFEWTIMRLIRHYYSFPAPYFVTTIIDNPLRRNWLQNVKTMIKRMDLSPNMTLIEIGPGRGEYTKSIARAIPDGKLYAVDISETVIRKLKEKVSKAKITNLIPTLGNVYDLKEFADGSIDRVYSISAFPEIPDHVKALKEMIRVLKPNGLIVLSEIWIDPDFPRRSTEKKWAMEAGLELTGEYGHWFQYQLHFSKPKK